MPLLWGANPVIWGADPVIWGDDTSTPTPPSGTGAGSLSTLPYGGVYFGMCVPSPDVIAYLYSVKVAIRFKAEHTGSITGVRFWNRTNGGGESGFHTGTGGDIRVDLESDSSGLPSGSILRSSSTQAGAASLGSFPLVALTSPLAVTQDTIYHIVIRQLNSAAGTVSIQSLDTRPNGTPQFPFNMSWALLRSSGSSYAQTIYEVPVFEVVYADGIIKGQGYIGGDRPEATVTIGGQTRARQKFVATFATTATAVWLWTSRTHTAALDLTIAIRNASNALLSSQVLVSSAASNSAMATATDSPVNWQRITLTTPVALVAGQTYYIALTSATGAQWKMQAGINGSSTLLFNEDKAASWGGPALALAEDTRRAEYSSDGGTSWLPWPSGGFTDGLDLPILLELVPPTTQPIVVPIANPDASATQQDTAVAINVLANDSGEGLGLTTVTNPPNGTATIGGSGTITYTPDGGFVGTDTFSYTVTNTAGSAVGTVTVTVTAAPPPVITPPIASPDTATTQRDVAVVINVLANDVGTNMGLSSVTNPPNGSAVIGSGGTITYTPDSGFSGTDTFSYTVANSAGSATGTVTVTVTTAAPPVSIGRWKGSKAGQGRGISAAFMQVRLGGGTGIIANPDNAIVASGAVATIPVLSNDVPNTGITLDGIEVQASQGTATVIGSNVQYASTPPFVGTDTFRYRAKRTSDGATSQALVTVTVQSAGSGPTGEYPTPLRTRPIVTNRGDLESFYAQAIGGDLIKVANGVNLGGFNFNRNGDSAARPIVVAIDASAPHKNSAYFSDTVNITGRYNTLWGLRGMGQIFTVRGQGTVLRRILWTGARIRSLGGQPMQVDLEGNDLSVEYCEITDCDSRGISFHGSCRRGKVVHTYYHDFTVNATDQVYEPQQVGRRNSDYSEGDSMANGNEIGWCFFDNINQENDESEAPSIKQPYAHIHDCHFNNAKNPTLRLSTNSLFERCRCSGSSFFIVAGRGHTFVNCAVSHTQGFQLLKGTVNGETTTAPGNEHPSVFECRLHNCNGIIRVGVRHGEPDYTHRVRNIFIHGLTGSIANPQLAPNEWEQFATSTYPVETPPTYTSTSQGLLAGL